MDLSYKNARNQSRLALHQCLAIVLRKEGCHGDPGDFWMYENGYPLFQGLLSANALCWWNGSLSGATKTLEYKGYVNPGALLVGSEPCSLEILRNAWARRVLQPPQGYQIVALEEIEGCYVKPVTQTQWTPLPEAVCSVVLRLSSQGKPAGIETIRECLYMIFPHVSPPSEQVLYDTLAQLVAEKKLYHTANGYFIVTPERRRSRSLSRGGKRRTFDDCPARSMLMTTDEAIAAVHGEMATIRDGNITHQCIQTNLADVISGGNASDKILYPRTGKQQWHSIHSVRNQEHRTSFRLWSSSRRIRRSASTRTLAKHYHDTSSSTDGPHSDTSPTPKKSSLFSRIFRKSKRSQCQIHQNYGGQFPPSEWFNSKAVHLHSVGTQTTCETESILPYDTYEGTLPRSATLPRRHRRRLSGDLSYSRSRESTPPPQVLSKSATNTPVKIVAATSSAACRKSSRINLHKRAESKDTNVEETSSIKQSQQVDNSGPSSIESHRSSRSSGPPSSIESHRTVIRNDSKKDADAQSFTTNGRLKPAPTTGTGSGGSFVLEVTTSQGNPTCPSKTNTKTTATISNVTGVGANAKIFVQSSPIRSVITFKNDRNDADPNLVILNGETVGSKITNMNKNEVAESSHETTMNNNRKLSLQLPSKENLSCNLIKNISHKFSPESPTVVNPLMMKDFAKNCCARLGATTTPPSPSSENNLFIENELHDSKNKLPSDVEKNLLGSEPNIYTKEQRTFSKIEPCPSLNDLTFNFTSLAAQKILKGVSINSVDTLVELNMANGGEKQNNCDVVRTDFGVF